MHPELAPELLDTSPVLRKQFLQKLRMSEDDLQNSVKQILDWFESQPFLGAGPLGKKHVENLYLQKQGSIEATKSSMINYYFLKISIPEIFTGRDPQLPAINDTLKGITFCFQYPLSKSGERYLYVKFYDNVEKLDMVSFYKMFCMELDMKMRFDFTGDVIAVCDTRYIRNEHISQMTRKLMGKITYAMQQAYGINVKAVHFLVASGIAEEWIKLAETVFEKTAAFVLHKDLDSLQRSVERELLPKELGGDQDDVEEVQGRWMKEANNWRDWFLEEDKLFA